MKKQKENDIQLLSNQIVHNPIRIQKGPFINIILNDHLQLGAQATMTATAKKNFHFNVGGPGFDPWDWTNTLRAPQ